MHIGPWEGVLLPGTTACLQGGVSRPLILQEAAIQGPIVLKEAPVNLGPVISGVYSKSLGSALSGGPDHAWQSEAGHYYRP